MAVTKFNGSDFARYNPGDGTITYSTMTAKILDRTARAGQTPACGDCGEIIAEGQQYAMSEAVRHNGVTPRTDYHRTCIEPKLDRIH